MRKKYWVVWNTTSSVWQVKTNGSSLKNFKTKDLAKDFAVEKANNNKPSQVIIKKKDGKIETEWTYGDDPFPPKG